jgi:hypothetical protein
MYLLTEVVLTGVGQVIKQDPLVAAGVPLTGIVIGIDQAMKTAGFESRLIPIFNVALGILIGIGLNVQQGYTWDWFSSIIAGLYIVFAASGVYSGTSALRDYYSGSGNAKQAASDTTPPAGRA